MSFSTGDRCGPYEIVSKLGQGGMGEVFRARDSRLGRDVAIKVLPESLSRDPGRLARFEQEARATGLLNHPNILSVFDVGETASGAPYMVCELLEGETLRERLARGPLAATRVLDYAIQIARGLAAAHQRNVIHRDLKPENLLITPDHRVKILDFGLAKLVGQVIDDDAPTQVLAGQTTPGTVLGTVGYMSPEQVRGSEADLRSDIFSFGALLVEMQTGVRAFLASSAVETMNAILNHEACGLEKMPEGFARIAARCLEKNPDERFQSAQDVAFAIESLGSAPSMRPGALSSADRRVSKRAIALASLAVFATAVLAVLIFRTREGAVVGKARSFRQLTFRLGNVTGARFAPDGQVVVYSAAWDGNPLDVFMTRRSAVESRSLGFKSAGILAVSSKEEIAISQDCSVSWGQCLDGTLARAALAGGAPRQMLAHVAAAEWSPDGSALAVLRAVEGQFRLEYPQGTVVATTAGWMTSPRFSPDGKQIAFCEHPQLGDIGGSLAVVDLASRKKQILSSGWKSLMRLAWSPRGDKIWVSGSQRDIGVQIYEIAMDGTVRPVLKAPGDFELFDVSRSGDALIATATARTRLVKRTIGESSGNETQLSWLDWSTAAGISADGRTVLFYEFGHAAGGVPTAYVRHDDSDPVQLGPGKALALSPNAAFALVLSPAATELSILPLGAGDKRVLPKGPVKLYYSGGWFPEGNRVFFVGEGDDHRPATFVQDVGGGDPHMLGPSGVRGALVSPDGKQIAAYGIGDEILRVGLSGELDPIPGTSAGDSLMQWSADGKSLYIRTAAENSLRIVKHDLATGKRGLLTEIRPTDATGFIGFDTDGVKITADGRTCIYTYWRLMHELFLAEGLE